MYAYKIYYYYILEISVIILKYIKTKFMGLYIELL